MSIRFTAACAAALALLSFAAADRPLHARERPAAPVRQAVDLQVPHVPTALRTGDERRLVYELHLTNFAAQPLTLARVQVLDGDTRSVVLDLADAPLHAAAALPGAPEAEQRARSIAEGRRAIVYLSVPATDTRQRLLHRIELSPPGASAAPIEVVGGAVRVAPGAAPVLGAPLRGGPWAALYDPGMERGHRRVIYAVDGQARIPGRHAVDWMVAGPSGRHGARNPWAESDGFGADVLAVSDGVVAATRDGVPEPEKGAARAPVALADAPGNYVALDIGGGRYAFYEHLAPGLAVRPGQRVRRGQVIARVGSTGSASRPHLHLHVSDASAPLAAEGQPFELAGWRALGAYRSIEAFDRGEPWVESAAPDAQPADAGFPTPNAVVVFD